MDININLRVGNNQAAEKKEDGSAKGKRAKLNVTPISTFITSNLLLHEMCIFSIWRFSAFTLFFLENYMPQNTNRKTHTHEL